MAVIQEIDRLKAQLLASGIQERNQPLYQVIYQLIGLIRKGFEEVNQSLIVPSGPPSPTPTPEQNLIIGNNRLEQLEERNDITIVQQIVQSPSANRQVTQGTPNTGDTYQVNETWQLANQLPVTPSKLVGNVPFFIEQEAQIPEPLLLTNLVAVKGFEFNTWVPTIGGTGGQTGQAYGIFTNGYVWKLERFVSLHYIVQLTTLGTITGNVRIKNLPYPVTSWLNFRSSGAVNFLNMTTALSTLQSAVIPSATEMILLAAVGNSAVAVTELVQADLSNTTVFGGSIHYLSDV